MSNVDNALQSTLRAAIQREVDAFNLYTASAKMAKTPHARDLLTDLAAQEQGHRLKLEGLLQGKVFRVITKTQQQKVVDLKITDYLVEEPLAADSDFQTILIVAGKREKASHDLYEVLAQVAEDADTVKLFHFLASEELAHKSRIEKLYEEIIYKEN